MRSSYLPRLRQALVLGSVVAGASLLALAPTASAATQPAAVTLGSSPVVSPGLGSFGVYNFAVSHDGPNAFPFTIGAKRGHCVELTVSAASGAAVLRSDADAATNTAQADRITWILLSSRYHQDTPGASSLTPDQIGAAHQSAVWQYTNAGNPGAIYPDDPAVAAEATEIVAGAEANGLAAQQTPAMAVTGPSAACGPGTRTVQVSGAPFSSAELSITSANGTFTSGGKTQTVELGAQGTATTAVSGGVGTISLLGTVQQAKGVAADFESSQDFLYADLKPVPVQLNIELPPCAVETPVVPTGGVTVVTRPRANLRITKRGPQRVRSGRRTTYIIKVRNTSPVAARNVVLRDRLPSGMVLARRTRGMSIKGRTVSIRVGSIGPRRTVTRRVVVSVLRRTRGKRCNRVTVGSTNARSRGARTCTFVTRVQGRVSPAVTG